MRGPDRNHPFLNLTSLTGGGGGGGGPRPMALAGRHSSARADEKRDCGDTLRTPPAAGEATAVNKTEHMYKSKGITRMNKSKGETTSYASAAYKALTRGERMLAAAQGRQKCATHSGRRRM